MIEIEYKFEITPGEIDEIRSRLFDLGFAEHLPRTHELTVMYDNPQEIMQITDGRVRLRKTGEKTQISYKKPLTREGVKREIEHQTDVGNFGVMEEILEAMDYRRKSSYERYRTIFQGGNVEVMIDEFPFAIFVEIEGSDGDIGAVAEKLGFDLLKNLTESCDTLFTKWREERGLKPALHMTFDGYDK